MCLQPLARALTIAVVHHSDLIHKIGNTPLVELKHCSSSPDVPSVRQSWRAGTRAAASRIASRSLWQRRLNETAVRYMRYLHWIASADAYFTLLTDKIPLDDPEVASTMEVNISGRPTTGSAILRLLTSIPSGFVLALLGVVATIMASSRASSSSFARITRRRRTASTRE